MNRYLLRCLYCVLTCYFSTSSYAQLGKALYAGTSISSFRNATINSSGGAGYEIGYILFAKYSDRIEWNSSISFLQIKCKDIPAYTEKSDLSLAPSTLADYNQTTVSINSSQLNLSYSLSYYVIPDQLAVIGGFDIGMDLFSFTRKIRTGDENPPVILSVDSSTGYPELKSTPISDINTAMFYYGPTMGLSYTYNDRFMLYTKYTMFLNRYFIKDEMGGVDPLDASKASILRIGLAYKFLPSAKNSRF